MPSVTYRLMARLVHGLPLRSGKLGESLKGRREAAARWVAWARQAHLQRPLVWFHAASVGEAQTAAPVMARLHHARPGLTIMLTGSSPTLIGWPHRFGAARLDYVPREEPGTIRWSLQELRPSLLVFSRGDLWPELVAQASRCQIPIAIVAGHVRATSRSLQWPARGLYRRVVPRLRWIGAVSTQDAARWLTLGATSEITKVTGDPRHDAVLDRPTSLDRIQPLRVWGRRFSVLVAGSVEPSDEDVLLEAFGQVRVRRETAALMLVPHEPTEQAVARLVRKARRRSIPVGAWRTGDAAPTASCVVVQSLGLLFDLYVVADLAYVGGGFRPSGLHAVIEPAAYGIPVVVGPHWREVPDAVMLDTAKAITTIPNRTPIPTLTSVWLNLVADPAARIDQGLAARRALHQGAARRTAEALLTLLDHQ